MALPITTPVMSIDEFIAFALHSDHAGQNFEFINGEIIEKMPSSSENSGIAFNIGFEVRLYCRENNLPCYISTGDGAYRVGDNILAPDFAYKPTPLTSSYPDPTPPVWVVEVISPTDKPADIRKKRQRYLEAGILLWEFYPDEREMDVYAASQPPVTYRSADNIPVGVLEGLRIEMERLFR